MTCEPLFRLLKKEVPTIWNEQCQDAFEKINNYLMKPPILVPPVPKKPLLLYFTTTDIAMGALLAQYLEESRKENAIYYISKKMLAYEEKYSPLEKTCVALKSIKGRAIADHLAHCSLEEAEEIQRDFPDEDIMGIELESWKMYFDGATNQNRSGIGVLLISPTGTHILFSGRLIFPATNNATKYEACIIGLQAALGLEVKELKVYGDSALKISQIQNGRKIKEEKLIPCHECLQKWALKFSKIQHQYVPRMQNQIADTLAIMASMMDGPKEDEARPIVVQQKEEPAYCMSIEEDEAMNGKGEWYSNILQYLKDGTYLNSADKSDQLTIRRLSTNYIIYGERLCRRSYDIIHLLCVVTKEAQQIIKEVHESSYGSHMNAHTLSRKIMRQGYYCTTMEADYAAYVRKYHQCQVHGDLKHIPPMPLHTMTSP
ncbi:uncharacterized protein LOC115990453 [Quercus lobata]|uniref:uncharacterized protein LOC115990453 n=1 Tax=Quercus lobata TaxID=97700 RepID=UPI001248CA91|nr:uncharacterized protein LOC115990453 [Quercus lobata]